MAQVKAELRSPKGIKMSILIENKNILCAPTNFKLLSQIKSASVV
jgi:hypothetical protein